MGQNTKWRLSCQDGGRIQNGAKLSIWPPCRPAKVRDTNCHHIANSIPNNGWTPKYYTKLASKLKRNVRCDIVLVSVRCGSTIHQLPSRTTFEAILTPHVHSRAEHISTSHIYRRHQSSGNCGIIQEEISPWHTLVQGLQLTQQLINTKLFINRGTFGQSFTCHKVGKYGDSLILLLY